MTSLHSSCPVLATYPHLRISPFPSNARRSHRFQPSCSGGGGGIDRRNMLLGLGGLYGASTLFSDRKAAADPIAAPDFKSCDTHGAVDGRSGKNLDVNCCPPFSDTYTDYQLPAFTKPRLRRAAHLVDAEYVAKYNEAYRRMKALDATDPSDPRGFTQQANVHCAYCNGPHDQVGHPGVDLQIHNSWLFFPFHRWYLFFHEMILGSLIGDPGFALPFWNWDNPPGMQMPEMFDRPGTALHDPNRNQRHCRPAVVDLGGAAGDPQQMIDQNLSVMYNEMVSGAASAADFMGQPIRAGGTPGGPGASERGSHTAVHKWVGDPNRSFSEDMGNLYSAGRDPMFYSHHANVDRMWALWKNLRTDFNKDVFDGDYLNSAFMFYDQNKKLVRVKVVDCLDTKEMGYDYQHVPTPWTDYRPAMKTARAQTRNMFRRAQSSDEVVFPLTLDSTARVSVPKTSKGRADEVLVLEDIVADPTMFVKFDVYVNDEDDEPQQLNTAEYAGTYSQLPHRAHSDKAAICIRLSLKLLYDNIDIADDDSVMVTIVPRSNGQAVTIGGVKIVKAAR